MGCFLAMLGVDLSAGPNGGLRQTTSGLTIVEADAVPGEIRGFRVSAPRSLTLGVIRISGLRQQLS